MTTEQLIHRKRELEKELNQIEEKRRQVEEQRERVKHWFKSMRESGLGNLAIISAVAVVLCILCLASTTFAWFTSVATKESTGSADVVVTPGFTVKEKVNEAESDFASGSDLREGTNTFTISNTATSTDGYVTLTFEKGSNVCEGTFYVFVGKGSSKTVTVTVATGISDCEMNWQSNWGAAPTGYIDASAGLEVTSAGVYQAGKAPSNGQ